MPNKNLKIKPLADYILIEPLEKETKTASGILIPDTASKERPQEGKVLAVGAGKVDENGVTHAIQIKIGEKVMYKKWGGTEVKVEGKEMLLVKEEDILAIIEA